MRKSKVKKQIAKRKKAILESIIKKEYKGHEIRYDEIMDLCASGHISCGYLNNPHYDGKLFYGKCALTQSECKYPHSNYVSCIEYDKRYNNGTKEIN